MRGERLWACCSYFGIAGMSDTCYVGFDAGRYGMIETAVDGWMDRLCYHLPSRRLVLLNGRLARAPIFDGVGKSLEDTCKL